MAATWPGLEGTVSQCSEGPPPTPVKWMQAGTGFLFRRSSEWAPGNTSAGSVGTMLGAADLAQWEPGRKRRVSDVGSTPSISAKLQTRMGVVNL